MANITFVCYTVFYIEFMIRSLAERTRRKRTLFSILNSNGLIFHTILRPKTSNFSAGYLRLCYLAKDFNDISILESHKKSFYFRNDINVFRKPWIREILKLLLISASVHHSLRGFGSSRKIELFD